MSLDPTEELQETEGDKPNLGKANNLKTVGRKAWFLRSLVVVAVFVVWLLFGGSMSPTGIVLATLLVGAGGALIWFSYKSGDNS